MFDVAIIETGNGGDAQIMGNDLAVVNGIENMPYLAMFGGNDESTVPISSTIPQGEKAKDWWGNNLLLGSFPGQQFNSLCEKTINNTPLTSAGRIIIQNAILKDHEFLNAKTTVNVEIVSDDQIDIGIRIVQEQQTQIVTIKFKRQSTGDFSISDFNSDFL